MVKVWAEAEWGEVDNVATGVSPSDGGRLAMAAAGLVCGSVGID